MEFHQTFGVDDVVEATDKLISFWRSRGHGQLRYKVLHFSNLLRLSEASTWLLQGVEVLSVYRPEVVSVAQPT